MDQLLNLIADKTLNKEGLLSKVEQDFSLIPTLIEGVSSTKPAIRYTCGKVLMDLSEKYPQKLNPYMNTFAEILDSKYRILTWNAIFIIANLTQVDDKRKFDDIFDMYFSLLNNDYMVTVANLVSNSGKIALSKPYLMNKIVKELLKVEDIGITPHLTDECKSVIIEKTIQSFTLFFDKLNSESKMGVYNFVKRQLHSPRQTLRRKAELFVTKWTP